MYCMYIDNNDKPWPVLGFLVGYSLDGKPTVRLVEFTHFISVDHFPRVFPHSFTTSKVFS